MTIIRVNISVEERDWAYLKALNINLSSEIRNFLSVLRSQKQNSQQGINIQLEKLNLERNQKKLAELQTEIRISQDNIKFYEERQTTLKEEKLKEEQERIKAEKHCPKCSDILTEKNKRSINDDVVICQNCFLNSDWGDLCLN